MFLNKYETLLSNAEKEDITIDETSHFSGTRIKGLYCDGYIAINKDIETETERACILAEELGHYYTSSGDIIDQSNVSNRKQEYRARFWAYEKLVSLHGIISAYESGCRSAFEMSEYLDVTEDFFREAMESYRSKYGICKIVGNYAIYFEPIGILKMKG